MATSRNRHVYFRLSRDTVAQRWICRLGDSFHIIRGVKNTYQQYHCIKLASYARPHGWNHWQLECSFRNLRQQRNHPISALLTLCERKPPVVPLTGNPNVGKCRKYLHIMMSSLYELAANNGGWYLNELPRVNNSPSTYTHTHARTRTRTRAHTHAHTRTHTLQIESIKLTSMEDVSTRVLEKRIFKKVKPKNDLMYQDIYNCICQNTHKK